MSLWSILLWAAGAFVGLRLIVFALAAHTFARLRILPHAFSACAADALPPPLLLLFQRAAQQLESLGFEARGFAMLSPVLAGDDSPTPNLVLHGPGGCWALVYPAAAPTPGAPLELLLISYFADGSSLATLSGQKFALPGDVPGQRVIDNYRLRWEELVRDHLQALSSAPAPAQQLALEELLARSNGSAAAALRNLQSAPPRAAAEGLMLPWTRVLKLALRTLAAMSAYQKLQGARLEAAPFLPEAPEAQRWVELRALRLAELIRALPPRCSLRWASFLLSGVLFALSMAVYGSPAFIARITLVVLVHELGHWAAMRLTGYRQPSIFFVPFFGAATSGHKPDATLWQELSVLLAGPLPGIALGGLALCGGVPLSAGLRELAQLAIFVNAANLLPLWPLDGGRIVQRLLLRDRPRLELALFVASAGAFAVLAFALSEPLFGLVALSLVCSAQTSFRVGRCAQRALSLGARAQGDVLDSALRASEGHNDAFAQRVAIVRGVVERLRMPHSTPLQRWLGSAGYAGAVVFTALLLARAPEPRQASEQSIECSAVLDWAAAGLAPVQPSASVTACRAETAQPLQPLLAQVEQMAELPPALCLREPWAGTGYELSEQQQRARRNVRALERAVRSVWSDGDALGAPGELQIRARMLAAAEAQLEQRAQLSDFDPAASAAYLSYLRAGGERSTERRALEELLGAATSCPAAFHVFRAELNGQSELRVTSAGDPLALVRHFCRSGCSTVAMLPAY